MLQEFDSIVSIDVIGMKSYLDICPLTNYFLKLVDLLVCGSLMGFLF